MPNRNWSYDSRVRIDNGRVVSSTTPNYYQLVRQKQTLPENSHIYSVNNGSAPLLSFPVGTSCAYDVFPKVLFSAEQHLFPNDGADFTTISLSNPYYHHGGRDVRIRNGNLHRKIVSNKLVKKLGNRDIDLGVALGEARETAHFVQGAMLRTWRAFHSARKGDVSGMLKALEWSKTARPSKQRLRDVPDAASGVWLEYSYAVRPLLADVYGALSALEKRNRVPELVTVRASEEDEINFNLQALQQIPGHPSGWSEEMNAKGRMHTSGKITFTVANPFLYTLSQVGLTNPLNVAWELVPFSFVVDWFIPIGSWFNGLVPPQGISNVHGSMATKFEFHGDARYFSEGRYNFPSTFKSRTKYRTPISEIPRYHLVGATFDLSNSQIASGLSLLWSVGNGRKAEKGAYESAVKQYNLGSVTGKQGRSKENNYFPSDYARL